MLPYCSLLKIHLPTKEDFDFLAELSQELPSDLHSLESDGALFFCCSIDESVKYRELIVHKVNTYFNTEIKLNDEKQNISNSTFSFTI